MYVLYVTELRRDRSLLGDTHSLFEGLLFLQVYRFFVPINNIDLDDIHDLGSW